MLHTSPATLEEMQVYLIDGAMTVVAGIVILIVGWWLSAHLARWTRSAPDRIHHFDETLKPLVGTLVRYAVDLLVRSWVHNADGESVKFDLQKSIRGAVSPQRYRASHTAAHDAGQCA